MTIRILILFCISLTISVYGKDTRILDGIPVNVNELPYTVSIQFTDHDLHFCTGAIISEKHILTAGHCFFGKTEYYDRIKIYTGSNSPGPTSGQAHEILKVHIHPAFRGVPMSIHDIAVVTLKEAMEMNDSQKKIKLPHADIIPELFGIVSSWGSPVLGNTFPSPILRKCTMQIMRMSTCNKFFREPLAENQYCAFNMFGRMLNQGDSGAPMVSGDYIIGISLSNYPQYKDYPDVYTNVFYYLSFINFIVRNEQPN